MALPPSLGELLLILGRGWGPPRAGHSFSHSQEPVATRQAPQDASSREGPAGPMPGWVLLAVDDLVRERGWAEYMCVCARVLDSGYVGVDLKVSIRR